MFTVSRSRTPGPVPGAACPIRLARPISCRACVASASCCCVVFSLEDVLESTTYMHLSFIRHAAYELTQRHAAKCCFNCKHVTLSDAMVATGLRRLLQNSFTGAHDLRSKPGARARRRTGAAQPQATRTAALRIATDRSRLSPSSGQVPPGTGEACRRRQAPENGRTRRCHLERREEHCCCCRGVTDTAS